MGKILAYAGVLEGKEVSWMPSYGPEMRGGTANVTVIISDEPVSSPVLHEFDTAIILNQQSMTKFESAVKSGGILIYDPNGITMPPTRTDITVYTIAAADESLKLGNSRVFNTMILGGFIKVKPIVSDDSINLALKKSLPERLHKLLEINKQAVTHGANVIAKQ